jgi:hypothetical protein
MSQIKRRPLSPAKPENSDAPKPTKPRRKKTDDYLSSDGPNGQVVYKRGDANKYGGKPKPYDKRGPGGPKDSRPRSDKFKDSPRRPFRSNQSSEDAPNYQRPNSSSRYNKDRNDRNERSDRGDRSDRSDRPARYDRDYQKPSQGQGEDRYARYDRNDRSERSENRSPGYERSERNERNERSENRSPGYERSDKRPPRRNSDGYSQSGPKQPWKSGAPRTPYRSPKTSSYGDKAPKPTKSFLKASQSAALVAAIDREIPAAIKRLTESEDRLRKSAELILTLMESLQGVLESASNFSPNSNTAEDVTKTFKELFFPAHGLVGQLGQAASFDDLVGQRLMRVTDFLEDLKLILEEIIEDNPMPKAREKSSREKAASDKSSKSANKPATKSSQKVKTKPIIFDDEYGPEDLLDDDIDGIIIFEDQEGDQESFQESDQDDTASDLKDQGKPDKPEKQDKQDKQGKASEGKKTKMNKMANTFKKAKDLANSSLFGPDDEAIDQTEVDELVDRLFGPSDRTDE